MAQGSYFLIKEIASGKILSTPTEFMKLTKQRVLLTISLFSRSNIEAGIPQGFVIGPLLFLIYTSNL